MKLSDYWLYMRNFPESCQLLITHTVTVIMLMCCPSCCVRTLETPLSPSFCLSVCLSLTVTTWADCCAAFKQHQVLTADNPFFFPAELKKWNTPSKKSFEEEAEWGRARTLVSPLSWCLVSFLSLCLPLCLSSYFDERKDLCIYGLSVPTFSGGLPLTPPTLPFTLSM